MTNHKSLVSRLRWVELAGQVMVLAAFGLQLFIVEPSISEAARGRELRSELRIPLEKIRTISQDLSEPIRSTNEQMVSSLDETIENINTAILANEAVRSSSRPYFAALFVIGGILAAIGKAASIRYSTK